MRLGELRIVMPLSLDEYQRGQLWSVAEVSRRETGGGEGIEVVENGPFEGRDLFGGRYHEGQYTNKAVHVDRKLPRLLRRLFRGKDLKLRERSWNAFPYCLTILDNPGYLKEDFWLKTETLHLADRGTSENALQVGADELATRTVEYVDIGSERWLNKGDSTADTDPTTFRSAVTARGPLASGWQQTVEPAMCAYKLVSVHFRWRGLQNAVERYLLNEGRRFALKFHREMFCWMDNWVGMDMLQIRQVEEETRRQLDEQRQKGQVRGVVYD